jgi:hypothetical protein
VVEFEVDLFLRITTLDYSGVPEVYPRWRYSILARLSSWGVLINIDPVGVWVSAVWVCAASA